MQKGLIIQFVLNQITHFFFGIHDTITYPITALLFLLLTSTVYRFLKNKNNTHQDTLKLKNNFLMKKNHTFNSFAACFNSIFLAFFFDIAIVGENLCGFLIFLSEASNRKEIKFNILLCITETIIHYENQRCITQNADLSITNKN